jgi:hypothetical protein
MSSSVVIPISNVPHKYSSPEEVVKYSFWVVKDSILKVTDANVADMLKRIVMKCFMYFS